MSLLNNMRLFNNIYNINQLNVLTLLLSKETTGHRSLSPTPQLVGYIGLKHTHVACKSFSIVGSINGPTFRKSIPRVSKKDSLGTLENTVHLLLTYYHCTWPKGADLTSPIHIMRGTMSRAFSSIRTRSAI